jgi:hypothetical protein
MSVHEKPFWLERWWPLLLILIGVSLALLFALFKPTT